MISSQICFKHNSAIHHFNGSHTVITNVIPIHTTIPITSIITHSEIIQRMNRQTNITIKFTCIKNLRMPNTELFKFIFIQFKPINKLRHNTHKLHILINLQRLAIIMRTTVKDKIINIFISFKIN